MFGQPISHVEKPSMLDPHTHTHAHTHPSPPQVCKQTWFETKTNQASLTMQYHNSHSHTQAVSPARHAQHSPQHTHTCINKANTHTHKHDLTMLSATITFLQHHLNTQFAAAVCFPTICQHRTSQHPVNK